MMCPSWNTTLMSHRRGKACEVQKKDPGFLVDKPASLYYTYIDTVARGQKQGSKMRFVNKFPTHLIRQIGNKILYASEYMGMLLVCDLGVRKSNFGVLRW